MQGPYVVFNELPSGGGLDYQGAAFCVNLTLKNERRKTGVQQEGKEKGRWEEELPSELR